MNICMEDRFTRLRADGGGAVAAERTEIEARLQSVLELAPPMFDAVTTDLVAVGIERGEVLAKLRRDSLRRLNRSIDRGVRAAGQTKAEISAAASRGA